MKKLSNYIVPIILIFLLTVFHIFFVTFKVYGDSMVPNLHDGKYGLAKRLHSEKEINRYDIVIIKNNSRNIVKRIIGLPNEIIEMKDNKLYINGKLTKEKYSIGQTEDFKVKLYDKEYFVLGDNREESADSRAYGPFKSKQIKAKILIGGK